MDVDNGRDKQVDKGKGKGFDQSKEEDRRLARRVIRAERERRKAEIIQKYAPRDVKGIILNPMDLDLNSTTNLTPMTTHYDNYDVIPNDFATMTTRPVDFDIRQKYYFDGERFIRNLLIFYRGWFDVVEFKIGGRRHVFSLPFNKNDTRAHKWARDTWEENVEEMLKVPSLKSQPYLLQWYMAKDFLHAFLPSTKHGWFGPAPEAIPDCYQIGTEKHDVTMTGMASILHMICPFKDPHSHEPIVEESAPASNSHMTVTAESSRRNQQSAEDPDGDHEMNIDSVSELSHSYETAEEEQVTSSIPHMMIPAGIPSRDERSAEETPNDREMSMESPLTSPASGTAAHKMMAFVKFLRQNQPYSGEPAVDFEMSMDSSPEPDTSNQVSVEAPFTTSITDMTIPTETARRDKRPAEESLDERVPKRTKNPVCRVRNKFAGSL